MLDLIVQWYPYGCGEDVLVFFHDGIHLLFPCGGNLLGGHGCGFDLPLTLRANQKENKFPSLEDDLTAFLSRDQRSGGRWGYLRYLV